MSVVQLKTKQILKSQNKETQLVATMSLSYKSKVSSNSSVSGHNFGEKLIFSRDDLLVI